MLPYGLAIAVGLSSSILFLTAFFMPKIHRQDDFFWSGLGFFYALVLWFCAAQFTGAVLLGQLAAVALLISYAWQVIKLRKAVVNPSEQMNLNRFSVTGFLGGLLNRSPKVAEPKVTEPEEIPQEQAAEEFEEVSETVEETEKGDQFPIIPVTEEVVAEEEEVVVVAEEEVVVDGIEDTIPETLEETLTETTEPNLAEESQDISIEAATVAESETESTTSSDVPDIDNKKPGLFGKILNFGTKEPKPDPEKTNSIINTKLDELLDDETEEAPETREVTTANSEPAPTETGAVATPPEEKAVEEESNWDFLEDEAETTLEVITEETATEDTATIEPEKPSSEKETN
ncbi:Ycf66 protein [Xenococcus sp. PCC 7305]|uniref:Ycf66 family protein n=1 Tax=Xenococcus sp. PCC 7305 TaxID=102125 RepID=UPI0002AC8DFA|nr:Ycf66 family protein [Xenococcus sp. PCC 7305]ELS02653.1 Ycf66 protein [Xenococcus sp. PCC 7305]